MSFSRSLKEHSIQIWEEGYHHPFVQELGKGTLKQDTFQFYLLQDYHYLLQYAKVFALATLKSTTEELITRFSTIQHQTLTQELNLHRQYMKEFGITAEDMNATEASLYNRTYTANMLAVGQTGDLAEVLAAVFPCAWTYADYATRLKEDYADVLEGNFYKSWIESYASTEYAESFGWFYDTLDKLCESKNETELKEVRRIFTSSVEFEYLFWDMAYKKELSYLL